ncbi:MAG: FtsW/RodA/SpoVE family cell cycle protein [Candidatus Latescibacterota bacterium]|nr:MAG: FtsW/RodA/SpoVE family cell cycle protein [Candidatus Latescibacterota bacterium]
MRNLNAPNLECDRRVLMIVFVLMAVGASFVGSSSSHFSAAKFQDPYFLLKKHLVRVLVAGFFLLLAIRVDYRIFRKISPAAFVVGVVMLMGLFIFGHVIRDTARWYRIESLQMTIQPAEFARLALVMFLASWIARKGNELRDFVHGFLPAGLAVVVVIGLMAAQPNYGTAAATVIIGFLILFVGGARIPHLFALGAALAGTALIRIMSVGYLRERIMAYLHKGENISDTNWQPYQSLVGLGSGGIFGIGFGESRQKLSWLPDSHTDFIFSILGEETGLIGTLIVSLLFLLLALRALKISTKSGDTFGGLLVVGIGGSVFVYAVLNMLVATGLFPVTGLPLPFLSYGGSALVVNAFSIGILLNVSKKRSHRGPNGKRRKRQRAIPRGATCV